MFDGGSLTYGCIWSCWMDDIVQWQMDPSRIHLVDIERLKVRMFWKQVANIMIFSDSMLGLHKQNLSISWVAQSPLPQYYPC